MLAILSFGISGFAGSGGDFRDWETFRALGLIGLVFTFVPSAIYLGLTLIAQAKGARIITTIYVVALAVVLCLGVSSFGGELHAPVFGYAVIPTVLVVGVMTIILSQTQMFQSRSTSDPNTRSDTDA
ncbi:MAG: hypothetical protein R3F11_18375 [Verrucomicrobiales bacterium]